MATRSFSILALPLGKYTPGGHFSFQPDERGSVPTILMNDDASYLCESCGEEIVIPVDFSQGRHQQFTEDCPVCCHANLITIDIDDTGEIQVRSELEYR